MMEFYNERHCKARKQHTCECCKKTIKPGEEYCYQAGKWEGEFFTRCYCLTCDNLVYEYCSEVDNEFDYSEIYDYAREKVCYGCQQYIDDDCDEDILLCPKVREHFTPKKDGADNA